MKITTSTGAVLEDSSMTRLLDATAKRYNLPIRAFVATSTDGRKEYVLVENQEVIYACPRLEDTACRLDWIALQRRVA